MTSVNKFSILSGEYKEKQNFKIRNLKKISESVKEIVSLKDKKTEDEIEMKEDDRIITIITKNEEKPNEKEEKKELKNSFEKIKEKLSKIKKEFKIIQITHENTDLLVNKNEIDEIEELIQGELITKKWNPNYSLEINTKKNSKCMEYNSEHFKKKRNKM